MVELQKTKQNYVNIEWYPNIVKCQKNQEITLAVDHRVIHCLSVQ